MLEGLDRGARRRPEGPRGVLACGQPEEGQAAAQVADGGAAVAAG
jgi:hypothetical protein